VGLEVEAEGSGGAGSGIGLGGEGLYQHGITRHVAGCQLYDPPEDVAADVAADVARPRALGGRGRTKLSKAGAHRERKQQHAPEPQLPPLPRSLLSHLLLPLLPFLPRPQPLRPAWCIRHCTAPWLIQGAPEGHQEPAPPASA